METKAFKFEINGNGDHFYGTLKVTGKLTHEDYELFVPAFEQSLQCIKEPRVKMLVDITQWDGFELEAAWDDLKFGLSHGSEFTKIAVVGQGGLSQYGVKIVNWFTHYEMKYFEDIHEAKEWLDV
jgi:hypothetical protein